MTQQFVPGKFERLIQAQQYERQQGSPHALPGPAVIWGHHDSRPSPLSRKACPVLQYFQHSSRSVRTRWNPSNLCAQCCQGRKELVEKRLKEDKLTCSEDLGDLVRSLNHQKLASRTTCAPTRAARSSTAFSTRVSTIISLSIPPSWLPARLRVHASEHRARNPKQPRSLPSALLAMRLT